jgi:ferrous iron transport protein B
METTHSELASSKARRVAIAGNPNCGKSTIFNALTGLRQKVGNYPGVTVEKKEGTCFGTHGEPITVIDLPGCYSLQARSPDEIVSRDVLLGRQPDTPVPEVIVIVVDATNLERNLYLTAQILELGLPVVLALNMVDMAEKQDIRLDPSTLSEKLGIPVIPTVATAGVGLIALKQAISGKLPPAANCRAPQHEAVEKEAGTLGSLLHIPERAKRAEALLLLGSSEKAISSITDLPQSTRAQIAASQQNIRAAGIDPVAEIVEARYRWISRIVAEAVRGTNNSAARASDKLDAVLTHRFFGWLSFIGAMLTMFFAIFYLAQIPMDWIEAGFKLAGDFLQARMPEGDFRSLVVDGMLAGVTGVLIFLPQILILSLFLGFLEDSGYMARAAFMMDRLMSSVGLHGKSFIPMLSSFACAIPGVMATRTIENRKDRLVTILVAPLMSCSARIPVYTLLIAVLLPDAPAAMKSLIMLSMYMLGIAAAFTMAWLFKKTILRSETPFLLMEMPPYRVPSIKGLLLRIKERAILFLERAGTVILALSVLLWALTTYPKHESSNATESEKIAFSAAGRLGKAIEPLIAPLGFDWKIGIGLIGSLAAREVFVSTMSIVYNVESSDSRDSVEPLKDTMRAERHADDRPVYSPLVCIGLMVFYVLAMQCVSTLAVVRRETNSLRWPAFQFIYMSALAWLASFVVYQGGRLFGWQ